MKEGSIFHNVYNGKTILITGDTGFKGSWLSVWLNLLGAKVIGYSSYLPSRPCLFSVCGVDEFVHHIKGDIRDYNSLIKVFIKHKPDYIFHLAAQPIVNRAYADPKLTFETNVLGTVNVLECMRKYLPKSIAVIITSDKCYKNVGCRRGYRETDRMGGKDPYSSSKGCAELASYSYNESFFSKFNCGHRMVTARAGNVIGGGDWAADRLVPDCIRAWSKNEAALIRNPKATRPWQHVLEPLSGYLWVGASMARSKKLSGESFNFGPNYNMNASVNTLIKLLSTYFSGKNRWRYLAPKDMSAESMFLKVSSNKALKLLNWHAVLSFSNTVKMAAEWYEEYYKNKNKYMLDYTICQIEYYVSEAKKNGLVWTK